MQATSTPSSATSDLPQAPYRWSIKEEDWLREQGRHIPFSEITVLFIAKFQMVRSVKSLETKARALTGLRASARNHYDDNRYWPQEQIDWLEQLPHEPTGKCNWREVADAFADRFTNVSPVRNAKGLRLKTKALRAARAALEADSFLLVEES